MPIRRQYRWLYPIDWPQISASIRLVARRDDASNADARTAAWCSTSGTAAGGIATEDLAEREEESALESAGAGALSRRYSNPND